MAGLTKEAKAERLRFAAEVFGRSLSRESTERAVKVKYGLTKRQASKVMEELSDLWAAERIKLGIEGRRDEYRAAGLTVFQAAMARRIVAHNADGTPAVYPEGHPRAGQLIRTESPDLKRALGALGFLARLDGLHTAKVELEVTRSLIDTVRALPDLRDPPWAPGRGPARRIEAEVVTEDSPTANTLPAE